MKSKNLRMAFIPAALFVVGLSGCATLQSAPPTNVHQPMVVRPQPPAVAKPSNGSLYAPTTRSLFEDRKARYVGDILTIQLVERNTAQKSASMETERESATSAIVDLLGKISPAKLANLGVDASANNDFEASGEASASNQFNSTLTVSVIEVLPNGNLIVSGEKQMSINQGAEFIRFSGLVDPHTISRGNVVQSTQVADARIEYKGSGVIDESQRMGWLQRFFLNALPF